MKDKLIKLFQNYDVEYRTHGPNVKKGQVNINCPYCDEDDDCHLGINPTNGYWGCWRTKKHSGKDIYKLLSFLLKITVQDAKELYKNNISIEDRSLEFIVKSLDDKKLITKAKTIKSLDFYKEFKPLTVNDSSKRMGFCNYLYNRGFDNVNELSKEYHLMYAYSGLFDHRIIFPIYEQNQIVTWTGRSIYPTVTLRYMDLSPTESIQNIKNTLLNFNQIFKGGDVLFISEGPFDGIKLDWYLPEEARATCLFTKTISDRQVYLISKLSKLYKKIVLVLDKGEISSTIEIGDTLSFLPNIYLGNLDNIDADDCGELTEKQVIQLYKEYL